MYHVKLTMGANRFYAVSVDGGGEFGTVKFIDSWHLCQMKLEDLPKGFDLSVEDKGFFPHFFNTPAHYNTVLPHLPPLEYYG